MKDRGRCNVAMTRAQQVFWVLGGPLKLRRSDNAAEPLSPFVKLKRQLELTGQVHGLT